MTRTAAANPGRTNRRFIMLAVGLGLLGAILVYVAFSRSPESGGSGGGAATAPAVVAKADIPARTKITAAMLEVKLVPQDSLSGLGFATTAPVVGQVTRFPIAANEQVLSTKIVGLAPNAAVASRSLSYVIPAGKRAIAISADPVQDAGGLILPGDYVDIMVMYDVSFTSRTGSKETAAAYLVQTVLQNVEVLAVALAVVDVVPDANQPTGGTTTQRARNSEAKADPAATTVTLALTPDQAQRMYLAESKGTIRLALRPFGDSEERPVEYITEPELFPQNLPNPFLR